MVEKEPNKKLIKKGDKGLFFVNGKKGISVISENNITIGNISFPGKLLLGKNFGTHEITGVTIRVLPPTTEDFMENITRGPQVILPKDASDIVFLSGVHNSSAVLEAGSGSGSLTIAVASSLPENGKIFSFDKDKKNTEIAMKNIRKAGLEKKVEFITGDVTNTDFVKNTLSKYNVKKVDTVILDLPEPWDAVETVCSVLVTGGNLVCYLPTVNQVEKICGVLADRENPGFIRIQTVEKILRKWKVREGAVRPDYKMLGHSGFLTFARKV